MSEVKAVPEVVIEEEKLRCEQISVIGYISGCYYGDPNGPQLKVRTDKHPEGILLSPAQLPELPGGLNEWGNANIGKRIRLLQTTELEIMPDPPVPS